MTVEISFNIASNSIHSGEGNIEFILDAQRSYKIPIQFEYLSGNIVFYPQIIKFNEGFPSL